MEGFLSFINPFNKQSKIFSRDYRFNAVNNGSYIIIPLLKK